VSTVKEDKAAAQHARGGGADAQLEQELYQKRQKIYPRRVTGIFARLRVAAVLALLGLYYLVPWLRWGDRQAILFDLPARKFHIFGLTLWPQDFFFLALLMMIAALSLFFFTALAGRLWCGYSCPQTVWTEAFLWIERKVEGDRAAQMKLDKQPWNAHKIGRKFTKHALWLALSLWTGLTFVGYFTPIRELVLAFPFGLGPWETFWVFFYGFATYGNAGWMREQVCMYMCPYARFQSAMFDPNTLIISYDDARGEPRGARQRGIDYRERGLGDCIDCTMCVQVCPTGIDIRDGLQYECIGCAACIDICDEVMDKVGYPRGLIRYTTENALEGKKTRILRPRVVVYTVLLSVLTAVLAYGLLTRKPLELDIIRDRNALYRETNQGLTENFYTLKLINKSEQDHRYRITVSGLEGLRLIIADHEAIAVPAGEVLSLPVRVQVDPVNLTSMSNKIKFTMQTIDAPEIETTETARFLGPRV
jgi:cytochrome c oxidase accessory protein FixG